MPRIRYEDAEYISTDDIGCRKRSGLYPGFSLITVNSEDVAVIVVNVDAVVHIVVQVMVDLCNVLVDTVKNILQVAGIYNSLNSIGAFDSLDFCN